MNRIFGFALALVVVGGALYLLFPYLRTSQTEVPVDGSLEAAVKTETTHDESGTYLVDVDYPQFGIAAIDADIKSKVDSAVAEFKALPPNPPESATPQNEFTGTFENVYIGPDVVSVKLVLSQYTGGAHPMTIFSGLNYDRATGRQLLQDDAFTMVGMTVEEVSAQATAELRKKLGDSMFEEGANSNPENFSSFIISADTVTFIFQPYQTAAYAAGPQEVSFERR
ncbi:hypothetical protein A3A39_04685 [Candidatus Kaiserbacteria bacterium RIFCSPLOWO2_01_FULL_54_13]|uniref:DUF3298 domain-containing protein n=1 Tax=Candidatus Kaiserbacteria bacterium RIFCSPLOWO2_01_FULL_54_13 TaxID=1798512 RepID=A0A1F6F1V5_9BACT|nr:MAG: hypothetical protein A3A39_04685 [Candidatus Kaiserbacteria bacterium RIFCSPLOWO2_01_FULL_54_13]